MLAVAAAVRAAAPSAVGGPVHNRPVAVVAWNAPRPAEGAYLAGDRMQAVASPLGAMPWVASVAVA